ncbi:uncharacterized protein LOC129890499 [Solanum dulcamara]|uniref:uncharacterized protein LOC129890499 n=1 Tax=Solanum dulcamara TaxID=45834 RepID=UPI0024868EA2|nr:uncharacterized protein LOC129890499 [Solanum dulcamara]
MDLEPKVLWALKKLNLSLSEAANIRLEQINEMDEFLLREYERVAMYKERMELYHDRHIEKWEFCPGDLVLFFNSRLRLFLGKLKSKCSGPFTISRVFPHGAIEIEAHDRHKFKVNGQQVKLYLGSNEEAKTLRSSSMMKSE